jgi:hypothetical protein
MAVTGWGVFRAEWHHLKCVLLAVGTKEGELVMTDEADANLVVSLAGI